VGEASLAGGQLFDLLGTGQVVPVPPAASVRGPRHVVRSPRSQCCSRPRYSGGLAGPGVAIRLRDDPPPGTEAAGIKTEIGNQSFRATGITAYLKNGGTLEKAASMANHASTRMTQLYDRRHGETSLIR
jgi:hypothetical protein